MVHILNKLTYIPKETLKAGSQIFFLLSNKHTYIHTYIHTLEHTYRIDVGEAHYAQIISLLITFLFGVETWSYVVRTYSQTDRGDIHTQPLTLTCTHTHTQLPGFGLPVKFMMCSGTIAVSLMNLSHAYYIILTRGVGKNGSTVAVRCLVLRFCAFEGSFLTHQELHS